MDETNNFLPDRRRMRAEVVAHHILHVLEPWLDRLQRLEDFADKHRDTSRGSPKVHREVYEEIFTALYAAGVEVITDADRAQAGLEWRDAKGITPTELRIMERRLTTTMLQQSIPSGS